MPRGSCVPSRCFIKAFEILNNQRSTFPSTHSRHAQSIYSLCVHECYWKLSMFIVGWKKCRNLYAWPFRRCSKCTVVHIWKTGCKRRCGVTYSRPETTEMCSFRNPWTNNPPHVRRPTISFSFPPFTPFLQEWTVKCTFHTCVFRLLHNFSSESTERTRPVLHTVYVYRILCDSDDILLQSEIPSRSPSNRIEFYFQLTQKFPQSQNFHLIFKN